MLYHVFSLFTLMPTCGLSCFIIYLEELKIRLRQEYQENLIKIAIRTASEIKFL